MGRAMPQGTPQYKSAARYALAGDGSQAQPSAFYLSDAGTEEEIQGACL
jgi:hypothetical protein